MCAYVGWTGSCRETSVYVNANFRLGGQMTASAVSALDFGANRDARFQSKSFRALMRALGAPANPGVCWVSTMCYEPLDLLHAFIEPTVAALPNLRVFYRTVVTATEPCADTARTICALEAVSRRPTTGGGAAGWGKLLSETVEDWYSPSPSPDFDKTTLRLQGRVFIDATEFGDVLVTGAASRLRLPLMQGIEEPHELSPESDDQCGQAATLTFYMGLRNNTPRPPDPPVPPGGTAGRIPFDIPGSKPWTWDQIWTYRRAKIGPDTAHSAWGLPGVGDVTQQNWGGGNDLDNAYVFRSLSDAVWSAEHGRWSGGLNLTAVSMLEQRAFGWYHYFKQHWNQSKSSRLPGASVFLDRVSTGTRTGLAKMPYLRDTRRSVGLDGYRLPYTNISNAASSSPEGVHFPDAVAIGSYGHDTHVLSSCPAPGYLNAPKSKPYYIPMRALTNDGADNLLVCGKTMATTFSANSATRLHPVEWSSGVAAGAAATLLSGDGMRSPQYTTTRALTDGPGLTSLLQLLRSSDIQQPLDWSD